MSNKRSPEEQRRITEERLQRKADKKALREASTHIQEDLTPEQAAYVALIRAKAEEIGRTPRIADMLEHRNRIKHLFGPWPQALRAAGLLPAKHKPHHLDGE